MSLIVERKMDEAQPRPSVSQLIILLNLTRPAAVAFAGTDGFLVQRDQLRHRHELIPLADEVGYDALNGLRRKIVDIVEEQDRSVRRAVKRISVDLIRVFDAPVV